MAMQCLQPPCEFDEQGLKGFRLLDNINKGQREPQHIQTACFFGGPSRCGIDIKGIRAGVLALGAARVLQVKLLVFVERFENIADLRSLDVGHARRA
ncbi:hypothetical protein D3C86_1614780 [compost metagenome]